MLVNLSLLAGLLATSASVAAVNQHVIRSSRPHGGRSVQPVSGIDRDAAAPAAAAAIAGDEGNLAVRQLTRNRSKALTSSASSARPAPISTSQSASPSASSPATVARGMRTLGTAASSMSTTSSSAAVVPSSAPVSNGQKLVAVHHMVGNTYSYSQGMWAADIALAASSGFDAFALNLGTDSWQAAQVASAYAAAQAFGPSFKLFLSLDMTVFPCGSAGDAAALVNLAATYANHPNQAMFQSTGRPIVSTFAGEACTFGTSNWIDGWQNNVKSPFLTRTGKNFFFIPAVFSDPASFGSATVMDGVLNWNSGWPMGNTDAVWQSDDRYLGALGTKAYMAAVSPTFFTHYGPNSYNKNWLFKSDNFLYARRWQALVDNRNRIDSIEALTWNDYGESSYVGPIQGDQPNSQAWVDGFDHTALLAINKYYSTAFKTGSYPPITENVIYLSARPHSRTATASADPIGRPTGGQNGDPNGYLWTPDEFYALVFATQAGEVTLTSGSNIKKVAVSAGVNFLSQTLQVGAGMSASFNGVSCSPRFTFSGNPMTYNWNYLYASSS